MSDLMFYLSLFGVFGFVLIYSIHRFCSCLESVQNSQVDRDTERQDYLRLVSQVLEQKSVSQIDQTRLAHLHTQERSDAYHETLNARKPPVRTQPEDNSPPPLVNTDPDSLVAPHI